MKNIIVIFLLTFSVNMLAQEENQPKSKEIPKEVLKEYEKKAEEQTLSLDTLANLSKEQKEQVYSLNYNCLLDNHFDQLKADSLQKELLLVKARINSKKRDVIKDTRLLLNDNQLEGFKKAVKLEAKKSQEERREQRKKDNNFLNSNTKNQK